MSLTWDQISETGRLNWISQPLCLAALTTGKISVACLIYRLQSPTRWRTNFLIGLCTFMFIMNSILVVIIFTQCIPVQLLWDHSPTAPTGHCINPNILSILAQFAGSKSTLFFKIQKSANTHANNQLGYMAVMDLILAAIPVHMIWKLQIHMKKKIAICGLLSTGVS
jgi:hypothetical protein